MGQGQAPARRAGRTIQLVIFVGAIIIVVLLFAFLGSDADGAAIGEPAPTFTVRTINGEEIDTADMRGRVLVINFFGTWCDPCRAEAPTLQRLWEEYQDQGVLFLAVAYHDVDAKVLEFLREFGITFPMANSSTDIGGRLFGVTGVPETYVIDQEGILRYKRIGIVQPDALRAELDALIR